VKNNSSPQRVTFQRINSPINQYQGFILHEDHESCVIGFNMEGTEATIVCYYDEWKITKIGR